MDTRVLMFPQFQFHLWPDGGLGLKPRGCRENTDDESASPSPWRELRLHRDPGLLGTGEQHQELHRLFFFPISDVEEL